MSESLAMKCDPPWPAESASPRSLLQMQKLQGPTPGLLNQNLHFHKMPREVTAETLRFQKHCPRGSSSTDKYTITAREASQGRLVKYPDFLE